MIGPISTTIKESTIGHQLHSGQRGEIAWYHNGALKGIDRDGKGLDEPQIESFTHSMIGPITITIGERKQATSFVEARQERLPSTNMDI